MAIRGVGTASRGGGRTRVVAQVRVYPSPCRNGSWKGVGVNGESGIEGHGVEVCMCSVLNPEHPECISGGWTSIA